MRGRRSRRRAPSPGPTGGRAARRLSGPLALLLAAALAGCPDDGLQQVFPDAVVEARALDFGTLPVLNVGTLPLTIENRGRAALKLTDLTVQGDDAPFFVFAAPPEEVESGGRLELPVSFSPGAERPYTATLVLTTDDPDEPTFEIGLAGEGDTIASIEVEPPELNFGVVGEGRAAVQGLTIRSTGTADLIVESIVFEEGTPGAYQPVGSWQSGTVPRGGSVDLSAAFRPEAGLTETEGALLITSTDPERRVVRVPLHAELNRAPVPACGEELRAAPRDVVQLDGSGSTDPDGDLPLTYRWEVVRRPPDSSTFLQQDDTAAPTLELDVAGLWEVALSVTDALGIESVTRCSTVVRAIPADHLYVELVWDHPTTDLDLHLLDAGGTFKGAGDCWWGADACDFGVSGDTSDDPHLLRDDLAGFGPELITFPDPPDGEFRVLVDFAKTNGASPAATEATVRVFELGVIAAELTRSLPAAGTLWDVAVIAWPSGRVTAVDTVSTP